MKMGGRDSYDERYDHATSALSKGSLLDSKDEFLGTVLRYCSAVNRSFTLKRSNAQRVSYSIERCMSCCELFVFLIF